MISSFYFSNIDFEEITAQISVNRSASMWKNPDGGQASIYDLCINYPPVWPYFYAFQCLCLIE